MKKALVVLLVLACVGAAAFADDMAAPTAKWSAATWYGWAYAMPNSGAIVEQYDYSWVGAGAFRLGFSYTSSDGNAGFNARFTNTAPLNASMAVNVDRLNGWAKMFGGMLTVRAGLLDDYTIATADWNNFGKTDNKLGMYFDVSPVAGLDVGAFLPFPATSDAAANIFAPAGGAYAVVGASYAVPNLVTVVAGGDASNAVYFGANVKAVPNLTAILEAKISLASGNAMTFEENVGYAMGPLTVGARIGEVNDSNASTAFSWGIEPTVAYKVTDAIALNLIINAFNNPSQTWMSPIDAKAILPQGNVGDTNFGGGAFVTLTQSGFVLTAGGYYSAVTNAGALLFVNGDLSL
ncbi:MAG TPA: hypothetical protein VMF68_16885 [Spirochaetia bacterium]|nr:hypothetical protein [Spirochaetia bacterium]